MEKRCHKKLVTEAAVTETETAVTKSECCKCNSTRRVFCVCNNDARSVCLALCEHKSTGSDHIREKDGIWAVLAWLSIIVNLNKPVEEIVRNHWEKYGRTYFTRYDYENCEAEAGNQMMTELEKAIADPSFIHKTFVSDNAVSYKVKHADNFMYVDPIDNTITKNQGIRVIFDDNSRIIYRLSGTGSSGATIRIYIEKYESKIGNIYADAPTMLKPLVQIALDISRLKYYTGRTAPTVIT